MSIIAHAVFGDVAYDPASARNQWDTSVEWAGHTVDVDVTFDGGAVRAGTLDGAARFVTDLARFDTLARQGMREDFAAMVRDYLDFDGADDLLRAVFGTDDGDTLDAETFVAPMRLVRVGLYAHDADIRAVFDYTLGRDLTDQLAVVTFDGHATVARVAVES